MTKKRAAAKSDEQPRAAADPIPPGYKVIEIAVGPHPDGPTLQAEHRQTREEG
jgi:hypothetical protein